MSVFCLLEGGSYTLSLELSALAKDGMLEARLFKTEGNVWEMKSLLGFDGITSLNYIIVWFILYY